MCLLSCMAAQAQDSAQILTIDLSGGYQTSALQWSIAGNAGNAAVNVLSEVKWRALGGPVLNGGIRFTPFPRWFAGVDISSCFIKTGHATDNDYGANDRHLPTYHANLDSDEGSISAYRLYGGYHFLQRKRLELSVFAGYTINKANLFLLDHAAAVAGEKNLRCTYNTSWKGMIGGISGLYRVASWLEIAGDLQYGQLHYAAVADWNLIAAFQHPVSFRQYARGYDVRMSFSTVFRLNHYMVLLVSGVYNRSETGTGTDDLYLDSGAVQTTRFNGATTHALNLAVGTRFQF